MELAQVFFIGSVGASIGLALGVFLTMIAYRKKYIKKAGLPWKPLVGKVSHRTLLAVQRGYRIGYLKQPLDQITDKDFLRARCIGVTTLADIRRVIKSPEK